MPEVGNGFVATVVDSDAIYSAGLFNGDSLNNCTAQGVEVGAWCGQMSHRALIPALNVRVSGELLPDGGRVLDVERAVFLRRSRVCVANAELRLEERWFAPFHEPEVLVHELAFSNPSGEDVHVVLNVTSAGPSATPDLLLKMKLQPGLRLLHGSNRLPELAGTAVTEVAVAWNVPLEELLVPAGGAATFQALTVVSTSLRGPEPARTVVGLLRRLQGTDLFSRHAELWQERSLRGRIEVEGDLALAQAVNSSLYFLRASAREDWAHGLSPGGLASNAYNGHTFWDQETWMLPPLLLLEPELARSLLRYRFDRMEPARQRARACAPVNESFLAALNDRFQFHGGMKEAFWTENPWRIEHAHCNAEYVDRVAQEALLFSWESAATGTETVYLDGRLGPWGMFEQHLNGDIALAVKQLWYVTGDRDWLREVGMPLVNGTASFYSARVSERPQGGYDLAVVMGPDEYNYPVKNNAYTNAVAALTLDFAAEVAEELGLASSVHELFRRQAQGLFVPPVESPEQGLSYHPEYEGFPNGSPGESFYRPSPDCGAPGGCVKQADAILLNFPLGVRMEPDALANDLAFYENVTDPNGPAMTWALFALNWMAAGDYERSAEMFPRGFANVEPPFGVWTEYPRSFGNLGAVNFITGAGGFLQSLVFGAAGLRLERERLRVAPPPLSATGTGATRIVLRLSFLGARLRQEITEAVSFELLEHGHAPLCLGGQRLDLGKPLSVRGATELAVCKEIVV